MHLWLHTFNICGNLLLIKLDKESALFLQINRNGFKKQNIYGMKSSVNVMKLKFMQISTFVTALRYKNENLEIKVENSKPYL